MHLAYVLARKDYFECGDNGRVTHARGIAEGLSKLVDLDVYSSPSSKNYIKAHNVEAIKFSSNLFWQIALLHAVFFKRKKYDFVIVRYSTSLGWLHCLVFNLMFGSKWGFELNSLGYQQLSSKNKTKAFLGKYILMPAERLIMRFTPYVNCVSENLDNDINSYAKNSYVLPNAGYEVDLTVTRTKELPFKIIYFGMYHNYYDLINLASDISSLNDIELHCYGAGDQEDALLSISKQCNNVFLHGRYKFDDLIRGGIFNGNVFLVLPYKAGTIADYGSPTKLFEYLSLGLPIISTKVSQPYEILKELKSASDGSVFFYEESMVEVIQDINQSSCFNRNEAIDYFINSHTWDRRAKDYIESIKGQIN